MKQLSTSVGVRLSAYEKARLSRVAKQRGVSVAALIRDRFHAAGAPGALRERRAVTSCVSIKVRPETYAWATEQAKAAGMSVAEFLGDVTGRRNGRPRGG